MCHVGIFLFIDCQIYSSSTWDLNRLSDEKHIGRLGMISVKRLFERVYVHFESASSQVSPVVQTMIVCVPNESFTREIEVELL